jgi:hypothetical protein
MDMFSVRGHKIRMGKALRSQWNKILYSAEITDTCLFRPYFLMQPYFIAAGNKE